MLFQVLVHNPVSYPELKGNALVVGPGVESFISVAASHTEGSEYEIIVVQQKEGIQEVVLSFSFYLFSLGPKVSGTFLCTDVIVCLLTKETLKDPRYCYKNTQKKDL